MFVSSAIRPAQQTFPGPSGGPNMAAPEVSIPLSKCTFILCRLIKFSDFMRCKRIETLRALDETTKLIESVHVPTCIYTSKKHFSDLLTRNVSGGLLQSSLCHVFIIQLDMVLRPTFIMERMDISMLTMKLCMKSSIFLTLPIRVWG